MKFRRLVGCLWVVSICLATSSVANGATVLKAVSANVFLQSRGANSVEHALPSASYWFVDSTRLAESLGRKGHLLLTDFPGALHATVTLDLKPFHAALDSRTICIAGTAEGDIPVSAPSLIVYRGKVLGEPNSRVMLAVTNGTLFCSILRESGVTYVFGPEKNNPTAGAHIFLAESDLLATGPFTPFNCYNENLIQPNAPIPVEELRYEQRQKESSLSKDNTQSTAALLQTDIAVEADSSFFAAAGGDLNKVLGYIGALFSMSSAIYEDEANLTHHLTWIKVWTNSDPYHVNGNAYALEPLVQAYWKAHYASVPRDLAHIMTSVSYGGGGYGWFSLCDTNYSYSVSSPQTGHQYPTFAFTYDAYIISHEMGHNFSLPHSHTCYWAPPLDTCFTKTDPKLSIGDACDSLPITPRKSPGTIMSYCANANYSLSGNDFSQFKLEMTFSPRVDTVLRANAERAQCIQPPTEQVVILQSPRGSETFTADSTIDLQWTYANIQNVSLDFTSDGGTSWNPIASNLPASNGAYQWKLPNITSAQMLVRIRDAAPAGIAADTSLLFFAVTSRASVRESSVRDAVQFLLTPNPAKDMLMLTSTANIGTVEYQIVDEVGRILQVGSGMLDTHAPANLRVAGLPNGKYFLTIKYHSNDGAQMEQILSFVRD